MSKRERPDYHLLLITGRFEEVKTVNGKATVFMPFALNKYPSIKNVIDSNNTESEQDIYIREKLHSPFVNINHSEFKKNPEERRFLKFLKAENKKRVKAAGFDPKVRLNVSEPTILIL